MLDPHPAPVAAPTGSGAEHFPAVPGFELLREKGRGRHATVYKARRLSDSNTVALKLFHPGACDRAMAARLQERVAATASLQHLGVVRALEFKTVNGRSYLVMEYATGEALSNFLFRQQRFPAAKALSVLLHCARTLASVAPKGFYHGRLYPGALVLSRNNVRILGVGMGERPEHAAWSLQYPDLYDPLIYAAPEMMPSRSLPKTRQEGADIYALGGLFFHLLAGMPPHEGNDEGSIVAERVKYRTPFEHFPESAAAFTHPNLKAVVEAMLHPDPAQRPSYDALLSRLSAIQNTLQASDDLRPEDGKDSAPDGKTKSEKKEEAQPLDPKRAAVMLKAVLDLSGTGTPETKKSDAPHDHAKADAHSVKSSERLHAHPHMQPRVFGRNTVDAAFSLALFAMTGAVFVAAILLTLQPYLPPQYQFLRRATPINEPAATAPRAAPVKTDATIPPPALTNLAGSPEEQALAKKQLDTILKMLGSGDIQPSKGLVIVLRNIAERSGKLTETGIRALIHAGQIEVQMGAQTAAAAPAAPVNPGLPGVTTGLVEATPPATVATAEKEKPPATVPAATAAPAAQKAPEPAAPAAPAAKADPVIADAVTEARKALRTFSYIKAKDAVERAQVKADTPQKKMLVDFATMLNYEEGVYERVHATLKDRISKNPRHESPLQVFPRRDDPVGDDIIDFDERGLQIMAKGGPNKGLRVIPWERLKPGQCLGLLMPLISKNVLDDQLGLAVYAFNRGMTVEMEDALAKAGALENGKDKAAQLSDAFARLTRAAEGN